MTNTGAGFLGYNMFAYCNNNPVNYDDQTGYALGWTNQVAICDGMPCVSPRLQYSWPALPDEYDNGFGSDLEKALQDAEDFVDDQCRLIENTLESVGNRVDNINWDRVWTQTFITGASSAAGGAATGLLSGALGAPFTAGTSLPMCALIGGVIGAAGGLVSGFVYTVLDEYYK